MLWGTRRALRAVAAAEFLCLLGWRIADAGGRVGLLAATASGPVLVPSRGRVRGMLDVISGLLAAHRRALADPGSLDRPEPPLSETLARALRIAPRGSEAVLASALDTRGADFERDLAALSHRLQLSTVLMGTAAEDRPPAGTYLYRRPGGAARRADLGADPALDPGQHPAADPGKDPGRDRGADAAPPPDPRAALLHKAGVPAHPLGTGTAPGDMTHLVDLIDGRRR